MIYTLTTPKFFLFCSLSSGLLEVLLKIISLYLTSAELFFFMFVVTFFQNFKPERAEKHEATISQVDPIKAP